MLPRLIKNNVHNSESFWEIEAKDDTTVTRFGLSREGAKIRTTTRVCVGKNIGRSNETTSEQQAREEALSRWKSQLDKGYTLYKEATEKEIKMYEEVTLQKESQGGHNRKVKEQEGQTKPLKKGSTNDAPPLMLCSKWESKYLPILDEGVFVEPKLDGVRAAAYLSKGEVILSSRQKKQFPFLSHIKEALKPLLQEGVCLDGELYVHRVENEEGALSTGDRFCFITGAVSVGRKEPHPREDLVEYHIFDIVDHSLTKEERYSKIDSFRVDLPIVVVERRLVHTEKELMKKAERLISKGYEGVVIKTKSGLYSKRNGNRSRDVFKYKEFFDEEFEIVGFEKSEGTEEGAVIWICGSKDGDSFSVRMRGDLESRREMFTDAKSYIGKSLTVRYQQKSESGVPRFPVGVSIRDYE